MNSRQEAKLDEAINMMHAMIPQVSTNKTDINFLRSQNIKTQTELARHDERIDGMGKDVEAVGKKILGSNSYMKNATVRWTLIGKIAGALTAIFILIGMAVGSQ